MKIDVVCPLYNAINYLPKLYEGIYKQTGVTINSVYFAVTESTDGTEKYLLDNGLKFTHIKKGDFSHSLTRQKAVQSLSSDIVIFISQDIIFVNDKVFLELIKPIVENDNVVYSFSRQIALKGIERYVREYNYPNYSYVNSIDTLNQKGLKNFFASDACSAINRRVFMEIGGYDDKDLPTNEDMYYSNKVISLGYSVAYTHLSEVIHYHSYSLKQMYQRYYDTGVFFAQNPHFSKYSQNKEGFKLLFYVIRRAILRFDLVTLFKILPDMFARYFGNKKGKRDGQKRTN